MALYTKKQLAYERSIGLVLSNYDNKHFYDSTNSGGLVWTNDEFEQWLSTKEWPDDVKDNHRKLFTGTIYFDGQGGFSYE